jgi:hypothetical protein
MMPIGLIAGNFLLVETAPQRYRSGSEVMGLQIVPSPVKPEPVGPETLIYAELFYRVAEVRRRIEEELRSTERRHGKGRRLDCLGRAALRSRQLCAALAPLMGVRQVEL